MAYSMGSMAGVGVRFSSDLLTWTAVTKVIAAGPVYYATVMNAAGPDPQTLGPSFDIFYVDPFDSSNCARAQLMSVTVTTTFK